MPDLKKLKDDVERTIVLAELSEAQARLKKARAEEAEAEARMLVVRRHADTYGIKEPYCDDRDTVLGTWLGLR
jgi:septal ring factor EnvC (AmiA/AmiB activator)